MTKWKCGICGYIYEGEALPEGFTCPICKQPASVFVKVEEAAPATNKYAGTQTEKNLIAAFEGESGARNKYTYFAGVAKDEGYEQIAGLFLKTPQNELSHAKLWFKELGGLAILLLIYWLLPRVKTMNGPICMLALLKLPMQKASTSWLINSALLLKSSAIMKSAIEHCSRM